MEYSGYSDPSPLLRSEQKCRIRNREYGTNAVRYVSDTLLRQERRGRGKPVSSRLYSQWKDRESSGRCFPFRRLMRSTS